MKPEPLKDKMFLDTPEDYKIFSYEDIKSAVEWLKREINLDTTYREIGTDFTFSEVEVFLIHKFINKAFEDVMKKQEGI